jgi:hypothetical protein
MNDRIQISGLEPLIAPEEISAWPPAPGWYLVILLLMLILTYLLIRYIRKRNRNHYRILALKQVADIREEAGHTPKQEDIQALNQLLKLTALSAFPRADVAALSGRDWQEFLDATCADARLEVNQWNLLVFDILKNPDTVQISRQEWEILLSFAVGWIRKHKNPLNPKPKS